VISAAMFDPRPEIRMAARRRDIAGLVLALPGDASVTPG
jgi:hypothetical protein